MVINDYLFNDSLNFENRRNIKNTQKNRYNCGGYALGTFSWYCPYGEEFDAQARYDGCDYFYTNMPKEELDKEADTFADNMVKEFNGKVRIIQDIKDLKGSEYAVAFRTGADDFHFVKRTKGGQWLHKRGGYWRIERMSKKDVFSAEWCDGKYNSKVVLLGVQGA